MKIKPSFLVGECAIFILCAAILACAPRDDREDYSVSKDTICDFKKGRFQLCDTVYFAVFYDKQLARQDPVFIKVDAWKATKAFLYMRNMDGEFCIFDIEAETFSIYPNRDKIPPQHKEECNNLKVRK